MKQINYKNRSSIFDMDHNSQEFKDLKEEYHSTRIVDFVIKYNISSVSAQLIFWNKTRTREDKPKTRYNKKIELTISKEAEIERQKKYERLTNERLTLEKTLNTRRYMNEII